MNRYALSILTLCAGLPALAQAPAKEFTIGGDNLNIGVYAIIDVAVATTAHSLNFDPNLVCDTAPVVVFGKQRATGMISGGLSMSRWGIAGGFKVSEDWKAILVLESGFVINAGTTGNSALGLSQNRLTGPNWAGDSSVDGQIFNRASYVGLSSDKYGTVTFGRNNSIMIDILVPYDPLLTALVFSPLGFSGSYGGGGATDNSRVDSSIKYKVKVGDWNAGILYKFGGVAGASSAQTGSQFNLGYEHGPFGIQGSYVAFKDAFGVSNPGGTQALGTISCSAFDTTSFMVAAKYSFGQLVLKAGYEEMNYKNPSHPDQDKVLTSLFGQVVGSWNVAPYTSGTKKLKVSWGGGNYDFTNKLSLFLGGYYVRQDDYSGGATTPSGKSSGNTTYSSAMLDYKFTKRLDAYVAYMGVYAEGGPNAGLPFHSNETAAVGLRLKF